MNQTTPHLPVGLSSFWNSLIHRVEQTTPTLRMQVAGAFVMIAGAVVFFMRISNLEAAAEATIRIPIILVPLYYFGGKWRATALFVVIAAVYLAAARRSWLRRER